MKAIFLWFALILASLGIWFGSVVPQAAAELQTSFQQISLAPIPNYNYQNQYANPPIGEAVLQDIPFTIPTEANALNTYLGNNYTQRISMQVSNPLKVHLLLNSGNTWAPSAGSQLGSVTLDFEDGSVHEVKLIIGQNIREWSPHWNTVNTVPIRDRRSSTAKPGAARTALICSHLMYR